MTKIVCYNGPRPIETLKDGVHFFSVCDFLCSFMPPWMRDSVSMEVTLAPATMQHLFKTIFAFVDSDDEWSEKSGLATLVIGDSADSQVFAVCEAMGIPLLNKEQLLLLCVPSAPLTAANLTVSVTSGVSINDH